MAVYFLKVTTLSRGKGACVTRAAAYRAGERIRDERSGKLHNYSSRDDVAHKEIVLPSGLADSAEVDWARDRSRLWNAAEQAGKQRNARLAREVLVLLPHELTTAQRVELVRTFSQELADKYRNAIDFAIHPPRPTADERHHHAHILMTTREVTAGGLGARTQLDLSGAERHARGLRPYNADFPLIRERWAQVTNEALRAAGIARRIDHRTLQAQGIDREPKIQIPPKIRYAERKSGRSTAAGEQIRAAYRERVEARSKGGAEFARVMERQKAAALRGAIERARQTERLPKKIPRSALTKDELRQLERARRQANRDAPNQKRRERDKENAIAEREKPRAYHQAIAGRTAEDAAKEWLKQRESLRRQEASAADSAREWLKYRESLGRERTAADDAREWLAGREKQKQAESEQGHAHEQGISGPVDRGHDDSAKAGRTRDEGLEL